MVDGIDGVDVATYPVMLGLARTEPTTSTALAADVGLDRSAVTRYRLEAVGYVCRNPHRSDGRATSVELTAAGREQADVMHHRLSRVFDDMLNAWPVEAAEHFVAGLERFTTTLIELRR